MPPTTAKPYQKEPQVHSYLKVYPELAKFIEYDKPYNQQAYYDSAMKSVQHDRTASKAKSLEDIANYQMESLRRSKTNISDIILANHFDMWATFTFNGKVENTKKGLGISATTDRYDVDLCKKKMSKWLKNQRERYGAFEYLIVAEFHKDGALHFHAFINGYNGKIAPKNQVKHGKPVFTIKSYRLGFSDMQYIEQTEKSYRKISSYIKKYITKDMPIFSGRKRYWCSTKLIRPDIIKNPRIELMEKYKFDLRRKLECLTISTGRLIVQ
jgi:hypothetical protein